VLPFGPQGKDLVKGQEQVGLALEAVEELVKGSAPFQALCLGLGLHMGSHGNATTPFLG